METKLVGRIELWAFNRWIVRQHEERTFKRHPRWWRARQARRLHRTAAPCDCPTDSEIDAAIEAATANLTTRGTK